MSSALEVDDVVKSYPGRRGIVLDHLSFAVDDREFGASGAGF